ncbi:MAG: peptidase, partial [Porphyromonadaceae bacterium]|nr:peptidase [Porphyromonadaceae bacterium]
MRKLFLSSSFADVATLLPKFLLDVDLSGKKVSFIPTG